MILTIRPATMIEAKWLGWNLREEDRREVETITGMMAYAVVPDSFAASRRCYTVRCSDSNGRIEQDPCLIFGVTDDQRDPESGIVWLLGTDRIRGAALSILREMRYWMEGCLALYPNGVHNLVDKRNTTHLRWLKLLGFTFHGEHEVNGQLFVHAILRSYTGNVCRRQ